jgi:hypothetical protein
MRGARPRDGSSSSSTSGSATSDRANSARRFMPADNVFTSSSPSKFIRDNS